MLSKTAVCIDQNGARRLSFCAGPELPFCMSSLELDVVRCAGLYVSLLLSECLFCAHALWEVEVLWCTPGWTSGVWSLEAPCCARAKVLWMVRAS